MGQVVGWAKPYPLFWVLGGGTLGLATTEAQVLCVPPVELFSDAPVYLSSEL